MRQSFRRTNRRSPAVLAATAASILIAIACFKHFFWVPVPTRSHVCIVTCDFWGLPAAGGTATAYHLLASSLAQAEYARPVTFLAATQQLDLCQALQRNFTVDPLAPIHFECLQSQHFLPAVAQSYPYEGIGVAVVRWLRNEGQHCDLIHTHEWGGGMQQLALYVSMREKPGLRLVVEPHGGHYWSTQSSKQRLTDLFTLRVDDHERLTLQLADYVQAPSAYMLAYLRQRGFYLPASSGVISNIVPKAATSADIRQRKQVTQLAFFGRLEERKGLKLFCEAIELVERTLLNSNASQFRQIIFVGGPAQVDMVPSVEYLEKRTAHWATSVRILAGLSRHAAHKVLKENGTMIAFTSFVENSPFALAEACIEQIPFLTFDVGGVTALIDPDEHADVILSSVSSQILAEKLINVLQQGHMKTSVLSQEVKNGASNWQLWHSTHDTQRERLALADSKAHGVPGKHLKILNIKVVDRSKVLKNEICRTVQPGTGLLLVPSNFEMPSTKEENQLRALSSQLDRLKHDKHLGAIVFSALLPDGSVAFPSSPTWIVYHGSEAKCTSNVPILLLQDTFCSAFLAEAGDFKYFHSWLLIHHLRIAGLYCAAYPYPSFGHTNFSHSGAGCFSDRIPEFRKLSGDQASNLLGPAEDVLMAQHLAPWPQPAASLRADFDKFQGQHGWRYIAEDSKGMKLCWHCM